MQASCHEQVIGVLAAQPSTAMQLGWPSPADTGKMGTLASLTEMTVMIEEYEYHLSGGV